MTVGIYYATTTGKTEDVADRLHNFISSAEAPKDVSDVDDLSELEGLDGIICGIPTWNTGADEERSGTAWDSILEDIGELSLSGKKVAIFGLGDSSTYTFDESKSVIGESFCGLPLDEDSESDLTDSRLETWASQLKGEIPSLA